MAAGAGAGTLAVLALALAPATGTVPLRLLYQPVDHAPRGLAELWRVPQGRQIRYQPQLLSDGQVHS
jgi:hypothetical protein